MEDQMVRAMLFGKLQKIWAPIEGDVIFLLLVVYSADLDALWRVVLPPRQIL